MKTGLLPCLPDFAGRKCSLSANPTNWHNLGSGNDVILLGLGPANARNLPFIENAVRRNAKIYWLEEPKTLAALSSLPDFVSPPAEWSRLSAADLNPGKCEIFFYHPGLRLAPEFWGPIIASLEIAAMDIRKAARKKFVWLPGNNAMLLHRELEQAFEQIGSTQICAELPQNASWLELARIWDNSLPELALSINFRGLDAEGKIFHLCANQGVPVAIWMVDNPWHLLSGIKLPWWREAPLFVTDESFVEPLRRNGAKNVNFCPLAASGHMWRPISSQDRSPFFIGRAAFPQKKSFFAGVKISDALLRDACAVYTAGHAPDYHWWSQKCHAMPWPGKQGRAAGLGAEKFSALNRARWIKEAMKDGLQLVGDESWREFFPDVEVLPPIDYYGGLPDFYGRAQCILNVTSWLLPQSLNQRHFDVWAAGGLMLGDRTAGLDIFPAGLVDAIVLNKPEEFGAKLDYLKNHGEFARDLRESWRECLRKEHSYTHRLHFLMEHLGMNGGSYG